MSKHSNRPFNGGIVTIIRYRNLGESYRPSRRRINESEELSQERRDEILDDLEKCLIDYEGVSVILRPSDPVYVALPCKNADGAEIKKMLAWGTEFKPGTVRNIAGGIKSITSRIHQEALETAREEALEHYNGRGSAIGIGGFESIYLRLNRVWESNDPVTQFIIDSLRCDLDNIGWEYKFKADKFGGLDLDHPYPANGRLVGYFSIEVLRD